MCDRPFPSGLRLGMLNPRRNHTHMPPHSCSSCEHTHTQTDKRNTQNPRHESEILAPARNKKHEIHTQRHTQNDRELGETERSAVVHERCSAFSPAKSNNQVVAKTRIPSFLPFRGTLGWCSVVKNEETTVAYTIEEGAFRAEEVVYATAPYYLVA